MSTICVVFDLRSVHNIAVPIECCLDCQTTVCNSFVLQVNGEHYIFSTFGVLHVDADKTSESMSLAAWQRESVLFAAARCIPFFKNYLVQKAFHRFHFLKQIH